MQHSTTIPEGVDAGTHEQDPIRVQLFQLSVDATDAAQAGEKPVLQRLLARDQFLAYDANAIHREAGQLLAPLQTEKVEVVDGLGIFEKRRASQQTTWEHEAAARAVVDAAMAAGRINHPQDVVDVLLDCAGISYWRVGNPERGLLSLGLDVDEFRDKMPGRLYVEFKPTTSAGPK